jgi:hypothetical protein
VFEILCGPLLALGLIHPSNLVGKENVALEQAIKTHRESRGITLHFL